MVSKKKLLLGNYLNRSFIQTKNFFYYQFFIYLVMLLGFSVLFISFFKNHLFDFTFGHILYIAYFLIPLVYLLFKAIKGLIILQESVTNYHIEFISEFSVIYILAFQILLTYFLESIEGLFIYIVLCTSIYILATLFIFIFNHGKKYEELNNGDLRLIKRKHPIKEFLLFFIVSILLVGISYYLLSRNMGLNIYFWILSYFVMMFVCYFTFNDRFNETFYRLEILLLNEGLKKHKDEKVSILYK